MSYKSSLNSLEVSNAFKNYRFFGKLAPLPCPIPSDCTACCKCRQGIGRALHDGHIFRYCFFGVPCCLQFLCLGWWPATPCWQQQWPKLQDSVSQEFVAAYPPWVLLNFDEFCRSLLPPWTKRIHISSKVSLNSPLQALPPDLCQSLSPTQPSPSQPRCEPWEFWRTPGETLSPVNGKIWRPTSLEEKLLLKDVSYISYTWVFEKK